MGGPPRRQRRADDSGSDISRRTFLSGSILTLGGFALVQESDAFTQTVADRSAAFGVVDDDQAFVGLQVTTFVDAGEDGQELVTVTNNTGLDLTVSVDPVDSSQADIFPAEANLDPNGQQPFTVNISEDVSGGEDAFEFGISANSGQNFSVTTTRSTGVRNFRRNIEDRTANTNVVYYLSYRVVNVDSFDRFEVTVRNLDTQRNDLMNRIYDSTSVESVLRIPESDTDDGAEGDEYEFEMTVYDGPGSNDVALQRTVTDVANGSDPDGNDEFGGGPDDPALESMTVTDNSDLETDQTQFVVDFEASNIGESDEVRVTFDNTNHTWSDETVTVVGETTGTVAYPSDGSTEGGTTGDGYEITTAVVAESGLVTDSQTVTDVADGQNP